MKQIVRNPEVRQVASRQDTYDSSESLEVSVQQQIRTLQEEVYSITISYFRTLYFDFLLRSLLNKVLWLKPLKP